MGKVIAVCCSAKKSVRKQVVAEGVFKEDYGMVGDAHASSNTHRQVSLLAEESIEKMRQLGLEVGPGDFAENITTGGVELVSLPIGTKLAVGKAVVLEISQIGKECHTHCAIFRQVGKCVMPEEGVFARVVGGGAVVAGNTIQIVK
jgi:MOSC domain-containing protein YiiM